MTSLSKISKFRVLYILVLEVFFLGTGMAGNAQGNAFINLSAIDGIELTPDNILNYQIRTDVSKSVVINGKVRFRNSDMQFSYSFRYRLKEGLNNIGFDIISPTWNFSSTALKELFLQYKKLPYGTYEYCVTVIEDITSGEEKPEKLAEECLYQKVEEIFLINLLDPENDAKIYEYYPMLSWMVNYPFSYDLTYRLRVAEIKQGQNTENAITRNNPVYDERNLMQTGLTYPIYAKPLKKYQPYAWTVDAYYKGILLGGAQPWKFTIIEDSILATISKEQSYVEVNLEKGLSPIYAVGEIKLKYMAEEYRIDTMSVVLKNKDGKDIKHPFKEWALHKGENRTIIPFHDVVSLKHMQEYVLEMSTQHGEQYKVKFKYINPLYISK